MKLAAMIAPLLLLAGAIGAAQAALRGDAGESTALEASAEGSTLVLLQQQILAFKKSYGELEAAHEQLKATHEQLKMSSGPEPVPDPAAIPVPDPAAPPGLNITETEVNALQTAWGEAIKLISKTFTDKPDDPAKAFVTIALTKAAELYGYGQGDVLFKPTKASGDETFRDTGDKAMSYFVGEINMPEGGAPGIPGDSGFAINGGKGWSEVVFENHKIDLNGPVAIAMGKYKFTICCLSLGCATCDSAEDPVEVEYTFGYKRKLNAATKVLETRIFLHHSSLPYQAPPSVSADGG